MTEASTNSAGYEARATLAAGANQVTQTFSRCNVNVIGGDQINNYNHDSSNVTHPVHESGGEWLWNKVTGRQITKFLQKVNKCSWSNVCEPDMERYDLIEPKTDFYPQMKTGFNLYRGDYMPQDGFSAHCRPKVGSNITFQEYADLCKVTTKRRPFVIIGEPGSGKSILMKRLVRSYMIESSLQECDTIWTRVTRLFWNKPDSYDAVLHLNIRDIPILENATLAEVLFNPSITGLTSQQAHHGLQAILKKKVKIIIFLDGLDQAAWEPDDKKIVGPWDKSNTSTIFGNILNGRLLSDVPIVITSREHSIACLKQSMRPTSVAALVGFAEEDAGEFYCQVMGGDARKDWEEMRKSNPEIHRMCLVPLFLVFYMIIRKRYPDDPPDCASSVMMKVIRALIESDHFRNPAHVVTVINKLKLMAFRGTKERRVIFTQEDLREFGLDYKDISDIVIKAAGYTILGQGIFPGWYRYFFSHQMLQEALSALRVVEMDFVSFQKVVDDEFVLSHWNVVRNLSCGILKNPHVHQSTCDEIFEKRDLKRKCDYIMQSLESALKTPNLSSESKLGILAALREADELNMLRSFADSLDFSGSPLTPAMIHVLCSVMKGAGKATFFSIARCGIDDELLKVFQRGTSGLDIKIGTFDMTSNKWSDIKVLEIFFKTISMETFISDLPRDEHQNKVNVSLMWKILKAAAGLIREVHFCDFDGCIKMSNRKKIQLNIRKAILEEKSEENCHNLWETIFRTAGNSKYIFATRKNSSGFKRNSTLPFEASMEDEINKISMMEDSNSPDDVRQLDIDKANATVKELNEMVVFGVTLKIDTLDVEINKSTYVRLMHKLSRNISIETFITDLPRDEHQNKVDVALMKEILRAATGRVNEVYFRNLRGCNNAVSRKDQIKKFLGVAAETMSEMHRDDCASATSLWNKIRMNIEKVVLEKPSGENRYNLWQAFFQTATNSKFAFRTRRSPKESQRISRLLIELPMETMPWEIYILRDQNTSAGITPFDFGKISITTAEMNEMTSFGIRFQIKNFELRSCKSIPGAVWKHFGVWTKQYHIANIFSLTDPYLLHVKSLMEGYGEVETKRLQFRNRDGFALRTPGRTSHKANFQITTQKNVIMKPLTVKLCDKHLKLHPEKVGYIIESCKFSEVVFRKLPRFNVSYFADGLDMFTIKRLAVADVGAPKILRRIVECCRVQELYICQKRNLGQVPETAIVLPEDEWEKRFWV